jgi:hypothetical protein
MKKTENKNDAKVIKKAFGKPEKLDHEDLWLRNFILKRAWVDTDDLEYKETHID